MGRYDSCDLGSRHQQELQLQGKLHSVGEHDRGDPVYYINVIFI